MIESVADEQKLAAKRAEPKAPVMSGLYGVDLSQTVSGYIGVESRSSVWSSVEAFAGRNGSCWIYEGTAIERTWETWIASLGIPTTSASFSSTAAFRPPAASSRFDLPVSPPSALGRLKLH